MNSLQKDSCVASSSEAMPVSPLSFLLQKAERLLRVNQLSPEMSLFPCRMSAKELEGSCVTVPFLLRLQETVTPSPSLKEIFFFLNLAAFTHSKCGFMVDFFLNQLSSLALEPEWLAHTLVLKPLLSQKQKSLDCETSPL